MAARVSGQADAGEGRTYRRSAGTRIVGAGCALLFTGGAASFAVTNGATPGVVVLAGLALLSLVNLITACADRYTLSEAGIEYRNGLVSRLGGRPRRVAWSEVVRVREHRRLRASRSDAPPSALFLTLRSGGRIVLDSLENYDDILKTVRQRCGPDRFTT